MRVPAGCRHRCQVIEQHLLGGLLGRGNQQLSPTLLGRLDRGDLIVVGTRTKLASLEGRPLLIDTDDPALDGRLAGLIEITTGYEDRLSSPPKEGAH